MSADDIVIGLCVLAACGAMVFWAAATIRINAREFGRPKKRKVGHLAERQSLCPCGWDPLGDWCGMCGRKRNALGTWGSR